MCFNLELIIDWSINRYFHWSGSGARVETEIPLGVSRTTLIDKQGFKQNSIEHLQVYAPTTIN